MDNQPRNTVTKTTAMNALAPISLSQLADPPAGGSTDGEVERLYAALARVSSTSNPRTARLLAGGLRKMSQKVVEEAAEVALEAVRKRHGGVVRESADLLYHLVVLWRECGIQPDQIWTEMRQRALAIGLAEKLPKRHPRASGQP